MRDRQWVLLLSSFSEAGIFKSRIPGLCRFFFYACFLPPRQLVHMAAIGGSSLECVGHSLLFIQLRFKAALLLGSLWVELWPWCHSMDGQIHLTIVTEHLFRYTQWLYGLTHNAVPCWCAKCGLAWELSVVNGSFLLLTGECHMNATYAFTQDSASSCEIVLLKKTMKETIKTKGGCC